MIGLEPASARGISPPAALWPTSRGILARPVQARSLALDRGRGCWRRGTPARAFSRWPTRVGIASIGSPSASVLTLPSWPSAAAWSRAPGTSPATTGIPCGLTSPAGGAGARQQALLLAQERQRFSASVKRPYGPRHWTGSVRSVSPACAGISKGAAAAAARHDECVGGGHHRAGHGRRSGCRMRSVR